MSLHANDGVKNFFQWLFKPKDVAQESVAGQEQQPVQQKNTESVVTQNSQDDTDNKKSGDATTVLVDLARDEKEKSALAHVSRAITTANDEAEKIIAQLWEGKVPDGEKEEFLERLEALMYQESGAQKILRCTRSTVKNQYKRLTQIWNCSGDEQFAQDVVNIVHNVYLRAAITLEF